MKPRYAFYMLLGSMLVAQAALDPKDGESALEAFEARVTAPEAQAPPDAQAPPAPSADAADDAEAAGEEDANFAFEAMDEPVEEADPGA